MGHYRSEMMSDKEDLAERVNHALHRALNDFQEATKKKFIGDLIARLEVGEFLIFLRLQGVLEGTVSSLTFTRHVNAIEPNGKDLGIVLKALGMELEAYNEYIELKEEYDALPR